MNFRSHTREEVRDAIANGDQAYLLNTNTGDDDVLLGSAEEVLQDALAHFELEDLPDSWSLTRMDADWLD